jgi:hypothetical protein
MIILSFFFVMKKKVKSLKCLHLLNSVIKKRINLIEETLPMEEKNPNVYGIVKSMVENDKFKQQSP